MRGEREREREKGLTKVKLKQKLRLMSTDIGVPITGMRRKDDFERA